MHETDPLHTRSLPLGDFLSISCIWGKCQNNRQVYPALPATSESWIRLCIRSVDPTSKLTLPTHWVCPVASY